MLVAKLGGTNQKPTALRLVVIDRGDQALREFVGACEERVVPSRELDDSRLILDASALDVGWGGEILALARHPLPL
jgi:hypothetical protein